MNRLACSSGALLLWVATAAAAPAPLPKPERPGERFTPGQLERQLRERGVRATDVKRVGPRAWVVTCPESGAGSLVGPPPPRSVRVEAPDRPAAIRAFLKWSRKEDERRLRELQAARAIP
jgi:hypothetical protein